ncbi:MAG: hypothetical protein O2955_04935, partial [Planctomycetota bacterium]|nr:hypothetical protein [Planctomycetota bacterium]
EDIFAEATAFVHRIEFSCEARNEPNIIAGYRRDGVFTIYFSSDEMYQMTSEGHLRRALWGDVLFRTQGNTLAQLVRRRTPEITELVRHDLTPEELEKFIRRTNDRLKVLFDDLEQGRLHIVRQSPDGAEIVTDMMRSLRAILSSGLQLAPALPTKRR